MANIMGDMELKEERNRIWNILEDTMDLKFLITHIQVYIFSDRVELVNPGGLPPGMTYADLGKEKEHATWFFALWVDAMDGTGRKR
jgi:hypothetical protein